LCYQQPTFHNLNYIPMSILQIRKKRSKSRINYQDFVVAVSRSNKNIRANVIESKTRKNIFTVSSNNLKLSKTDKSKEVGKKIADFLKSKCKVDKAVFDRNGYLYHGRVKAVADSLRDSGIQI